MRAVTLCLTLLACLLCAAPAHALQQTLVASDGMEDDYFGADVAVDGDTAVVSATTGFQSAGLVYVFTRDGDTWTQTARLQGSDTESGDQFGVNVAIQGDTIVVGAPKHPNGPDLQAGAIYTFDRTGAPNRTETAKLTLPSPATTNAFFGSGVAIDGGVIAASAPAEGYIPNTDPAGPRGGYGAVYLFDRTGASGRAPKARLTAADKDFGDGLGEGRGLAIDGDTVVAGAKTKPDSGAGVVNQGAAYTFDAAATGNATSTDKLEASDKQALDYFGRSVDIDDQTIVVGASADSFPGRTYVGSAYTFESTGAHDQTSKLVTSDGKASDRVGWTVAVGGAQIAVGADLDDHGTSTTSNEGSVYLFPRSAPAGERFEGSRLTSPSPAPANYFGWALDMDGTTLMVGEEGDDVGANDEQGSATIYFAPATAPACSDGGDNDGDGKTDFPADPGCESPDDTSEADPVPGVKPSPGSSSTPGGLPPGVLPVAVDDGSKAPRIIRPRTQPPVTPTKERVIKVAARWACIEVPKDDTPCKAYGWVDIPYIAEDAKALKSAKKKRLRIGASRTTIPNGASKPVTMKLSKKAYKLLRKKKKLKARVEMQLSRRGAKTVTTSFSVTIKAPKKKKKR